MILSDRQIREAISQGDIVIDPFDPKALGTNSYDVHLGDTIKMYAPKHDPDWRLQWRCVRCAQAFSSDFIAHSHNCSDPHEGFQNPHEGLVLEEVHIHDPSRTRPWIEEPVLDCKRETPTVTYKIGPEGFVLRRGEFYLGVTQEYTESHKHVPFLDGKSSTGRNSIFIHCTAGRGDVGFCNHWTLEIVAMKSVRVYAGQPIGQLIYFETGPVDVPYNKKPGAKYNGRDPEPKSSQMFRNFSSERSCCLAGMIPGQAHALNCHRNPEEL